MNVRKISVSVLALACASCDVLEGIFDPPSHPPILPRPVEEPTLVGRAILPADTFASGPTSGTLLGDGPINGVEVPFVDKQPVQGFSSVLDNGDGTYWAMSDNGFGSQDNSADYLLRLYLIEPSFQTPKRGSGGIEVLGFVQLRDPMGLVDFQIVRGNTPERELTGADFDIESVQRDANGDLWIGDEFGPFILHFDADGVLLDTPVELPNFGGEGFVRAPQSPYLGADEVPLAQTSGGFEGMALTRDGRSLLTLLEKPLSNASERQLLISEFDLATASYTGTQYLYTLDDEAVAIGDFIMFNRRQGLVIERDGSQGDLDGFKAIFQIELRGPGEPVVKRRVVDLIDIADPYDIAEDVPGDVGVAGKRFAFPFVTIESVVVLNRFEIGVLNDNNYPFSIGRHVETGCPDDNEFVVIRLPEPLKLD